MRVAHGWMTGLFLRDGNQVIQPWATCLDMLTKFNTVKCDIDNGFQIIILESD